MRRRDRPPRKPPWPRWPPGPPKPPGPPGPPGPPNPSGPTLLKRSSLCMSRQYQIYRYMQDATRVRHTRQMRAERETCGEVYASRSRPRHSCPFRSVGAELGELDGLSSSHKLTFGPHRTRWAVAEATVVGRQARAKSSVDAFGLAGRGDDTGGIADGGWAGGRILSWCTGAAASIGSECSTWGTCGVSSFGGRAGRF